MPRTRKTPEQLLAARNARREVLSAKLIQACLGTEQDIKVALEEVDRVFFAAIEYALWIWFNDMLPEHFGPGASKKYGFPDRSAGYMMGKFTGKVMSGKVSRFKFPKATALRMAGGTDLKGTMSPDPFPLEFSGELRANVTNAPARPPEVIRVPGGYRGRIIISLPAYIRRDDIAALKRYLPEELQTMASAVQFVVKGALGL